jgi:MoxR-like ATPase
MAEGSVSVDGETHRLPRPFLMIATQNPVEQAGTFTLPEAQLDRFLFKLSVGYADLEAEIEVMKANFRNEAITGVGAVVDRDEVLALQDWPKGVQVREEVLRYIAQIVEATRQDSSLLLAASTRASLALLRASRVIACADGRDDVYPDDVKAILGAVLAHRVMLSPEAELREETVEKVIERITNRVKPPLLSRPAAV